MAGSSDNKEGTQPKKAFADNAKVVTITIKGWQVPEEHCASLYNIAKAGIDFEGNENTVREQALLVASLVTDMRQESYAGYGDNKTVAVKLLEHFDRTYLGKNDLNRRRYDEFADVAEKSIRFCSENEIDFGYKMAPKEYLTKEELIVKSEEKLAELFKQGLDFDNLKIVGTSEAFTVAEIIDWYKGFVGLPYTDAASALHEKMEEASLLKADTHHDFLAFVDKCGEVAREKNVIPDGSIPEFLWVCAGYDWHQLHQERKGLVERSIDLG